MAVHPSAPARYSPTEMAATSTQTVQRETVLFTGRVQGVGFRYCVKNLALGHAVTGYVRNLSDGRVELVMEGPEHEREALVQAVRDKMQDYVRHLDRHTSAGTGEFRDFSIRH
jgi:acylphosphatase